MEYPWILCGHSHVRQRKQQEQTMKRTFGAHSLGLCGILQPGDGEKLQAAAKTAVQAGATLFELACAPINTMSAEETAKALKAGGMFQASFCRFYPPGNTPDEPAPFGDPLGDRNTYSRALATVQSDVAFINELRKHGIEVRFITGPGAFVLSKEYDPQRSRENIRGGIFEHYRNVGRAIAGQDLEVAIEYLRDGEDMDVIASMNELCGIVDQIGNPDIGIHADTYHMQQRGEVPHEAIVLAGKSLKYLHAHGDKRLVPGAFQQGGDPLATDPINWHLIGCMLDQVNYNGPVVPEPFCRTIREAIPALGANLPEPIEPRAYYDQACDFLTHNHIL
jgi:sugar phosphate isomerase/epimerase